ncbi:hypothetical protein QQF12_14310 [Clostridium perfringens]|uniref:hypothetical protein n=1 Tax=Clostridium perfringens TaxID=1502 RepID=UPI0037497177
MDNSTSSKTKIKKYREKPKKTKNIQRHTGRKNKIPHIALKKNDTSFTNNLIKSNTKSTPLDNSTSSKTKIKKYREKPKKTKNIQRHTGRKNKIPHIALKKNDTSFTNNLIKSNTKSTPLDNSTSSKTKIKKYREKPKKTKNIQRHTGRKNKIPHIALKKNDTSFTNNLIKSNTKSTPLDNSTSSIQRHTGRKNKIPHIALKKNDTSFTNNLIKSNTKSTPLDNSTSSKTKIKKYREKPKKTKNIQRHTGRKNKIPHIALKKNDTSFTNNLIKSNTKSTPLDNSTSSKTKIKKYREKPKKTKNIQRHTGRKNKIPHIALKKNDTSFTNNLIKSI